MTFMSFKKNEILQKVKHDKSKMSAVAGYVVMSTLSLSCSILNYKDFLPFSNDEIKRHARSNVCQCVYSTMRMFIHFCMYAHI